jgi:hypothetical protein
MKLRSFFLLALPVCVNACELEQPNLRVYCDVNKTIILTDKVQGKELEDTLKAVQAEFTFHTWDGHTNQSYYEMVTAKLTKENPTLLQTTDEFKKKRGELLKDFPNYLKKFPELFAQYQNDRARMMEIVGSDKLVIFPSFIKLIAWLNLQYKGHYALYLRTFGTDLPEVRSKIENQTDLKFEGLGEFKGRTLSLASSYMEFFSNPKLGHYGIRDDFNYWKSTGYQAKGGKLFPVGLNKKDIEIFFDDNADDAVKPIICPVDSKESIIDTNELLKKGIIVAVNPQQAILDEDYFINALKRRIAQS